VVGFAGGEIEKVCSSSSFHIHSTFSPAAHNLDCPPQLALNLVLLKNISIVGIHWGRYNLVEPERAKQVWEDLFACVLDHRRRHSSFFRLMLLIEITESRVADA